MVSDVNLWQTGDEQQHLSPLHQQLFSLYVQKTMYKFGNIHSIYSA